MKKRMKITLGIIASFSIIGISTLLVVSCGASNLPTKGNPNTATSDANLYTNVYTKTNASKSLSENTNPSNANSLLYGSSLVSYIGNYGSSNNNDPITSLNNLAKMQTLNYPLTNFDYVLTCTNYLSATSLNNNMHWTYFFYYYSFINNINGNLSYPNLKNDAINWSGSVQYNGRKYVNSGFDTLAQALQAGIIDYCYANSEVSLSKDVLMSDINPNLITITSFNWNELTSMLSFSIAYNNVAISSQISIYVPSYVTLNDINGNYVVSNGNANDGQITGTPGWNA